jgi:hypothetical protein
LSLRFSRGWPTASDENTLGERLIASLNGSTIHNPPPTFFFLPSLFSSVIIFDQEKRTFSSKSRPRRLSQLAFQCYFSPSGPLVFFAERGKPKDSRQKQHRFFMTTGTKILLLNQFFFSYRLEVCSLYLLFAERKTGGKSWHFCFDVSFLSISLTKARERHLYLCAGRGVQRGLARKTLLPRTKERAGGQR